MKQQLLCFPCACLGTISLSFTYRIIQSVLKLTLTEESILPCAVRARMVYLYIFP
jgi:hypothetical protein